eukprot:328975-Pleurochrysis_carterae.AAC.3
MVAHGLRIQLLPGQRSERCRNKKERRISRSKLSTRRTRTEQEVKGKLDRGKIKRRERGAAIA